MTYTSQTLLDRLYAQTEEQLALAISEWQQLPAEFFNAQPGPGQWSAAQCLEHLNSYGRYYLPAIERALQHHNTGTFSNTFRSGWLGNYFYKLMLPEQNGRPKKKMQSPRNHRPAEQLNAVKVIGEFISQLEKLEQLLNHAMQRDLNQVRVPISIAPFIKLKLGDVFLFYTAHIHRHILQAERAMRAAGYQPEIGNPVKENTREMAS